MIKIKLLKQHTHQSKQYQAGDVVEVAQSDADFIVKHGIGEVLKVTKNKQEEKANA
ncbi:DUF7210 family protein [Actinobacillus pleuropneumoniae]|uniref:DUF7210 family protein n=1 Tax=Actinobacillus pleuropneumoniae TaxID=715 RepID=UPI001F34BF1D|nr:hypothetical protein [Actinobacillus pleuropneumoniae]UPA21454.1 hypothetical protein JS559_03030 [Actinobacillus pleuropneumoniae]UPA21629.1 hypothetical protein JS559_03965 [Actinobacillus pleuropneumoniae]